MARLRCAPLVAVVQAADLWNGDHTSRSQRRDRTWKGCILVHGLEGFLVIESTLSLDVVAVYTAGKKGAEVESIDVEYVPERKR